MMVSILLPFFCSEVDSWIDSDLQIIDNNIIEDIRLERPTKGNHIA